LRAAVECDHTRTSALTFTFRAPTQLSCPAGPLHQIAGCGVARQKIDQLASLLFRQQASGLGEEFLGLDDSMKRSGGHQLYANGG